MENNLQDIFVPYAESLELKQLGFDEKCIALHTIIPEDDIKWFTIPEQGITDKHSFGSSKNYNSKSFEEEGSISSPTWEQAWKFMRCKYKINPVITCYSELGNAWKYHIPNEGGGQGFYTYEEARLECLRKLIEIVKNGK
jgi:hypothetical protein